MLSESMNYNQTVNKCLSQIQFHEDNPDGCTNAQEILRTYIVVAPSFLMLDSSNPETTDAGIDEWAMGMNSVVDILVALHSRLRGLMDDPNSTSSVMHFDGTK
jgi:hypothetical protein